QRHHGHRGGRGVEPSRAGPRRTAVPRSGRPAAARRAAGLCRGGRRRRVGRHAPRRGGAPAARVGRPPPAALPRAPPPRLPRAAQTETRRRMNALADNRTLRLLRARERIPAVLWVTLLAGAVLTVGFSYFFGVSNLRLHLLATATFAGTIALFIFVIVVLETP